MQKDHESKGFLKEINKTNRCYIHIERENTEDGIHREQAP